MQEGSLDAPTRHPLAWREPDFLDEAKLDEELRRVFDICHGCRRCFNLCDSFPKLFDLIDEAESMELDTVDSADFAPVVDACTLCDMCFMTKCPYVPPHEFNLDFPHLMLRYRAVQNAKGEIPFTAAQLTETDRNGKAAGFAAPIANWASKRGNVLTRPILESTCGVHKDAALPQFHTHDYVTRAKAEVPEVNTAAPAFGRSAIIYATCFVNYNNPAIGTAARQILAHNGVDTEVVYPSCCGMPQLEHGDIARVAETAAKVAAELRPWVDEGRTVIALTPSCALMLKFEWPLILPEDENVKALSAATQDIDQYIVDIAKTDGLAEGLTPLDGGVTLHIACHSRAQNFGQKSAEMLRYIPDIDITVIERCSGHGGSWGVMKENFETAIKVGKPVARQANKAGNAYIASGCPLAADHILQGMERVDGEAPTVKRADHPVEILAKAYGF
jgi:glycerol-3-phosphate dehydrogenase subunit C